MNLKVQATQNDFIVVDNEHKISEPFAIIIPDRGDRPTMTKRCLEMVNRFSMRPAKVYKIDYKPVSDSMDLTERVHLGVCKAKEDGIDLVFIVENDDYYPADYFERFGDTSQHDFFGCEHSYYYNIHKRYWSKIDHSHRSSLYNTGFRVSAVEKFMWPSDLRFLDINLWNYARIKRSKFIQSTGSVGIKAHGEGKSGGKGHVMKLKNKDEDFIWLKSKVDSESFKFYSYALQEKLHSVR